MTIENNMLLNNFWATKHQKCLNPKREEMLGEICEIDCGKCDVCRKSIDEIKKQILEEVD